MRVYLYDGSFEGFLCCVGYSYKNRERPMDIVSLESGQSMFYDTVVIDTDPDRAAAVYRFIADKTGQDRRSGNNQYTAGYVTPKVFVKLAFLSCLDKKEMLIYDFIGLAIKHGAEVLGQITNDVIHTLLKAVRHLEREAHLLKGFTRFKVLKSEPDEYMIAQISPKNMVLPLLAPHFCDRYKNQNFLVHDNVHSMALLYEKGQESMFGLDKFEPGELHEEEAEYQRLWKQFYNTIAIKERKNDRCRMSLMPKRFWSNMIEVQELV